MPLVGTGMKAAPMSSGCERVSAASASRTEPSKRLYPELSPPLADQAHPPVRSEAASAAGTVSDASGSQPAPVNLSSGGRESRSEQSPASPVVVAA